MLRCPQRDDDGPPYRPAMPLDKALQELIENAGTQFDPVMAETVVELVARS